MASLVKRPGSTIWYIQYQSQGKWKRVSTKTDKKKIAQEVLNHYKVEEAKEFNDLPTQHKRHTLGELVDRYLDHCAATMAPRWVHNKRLLLDKYLLPFLGESTPIKQITAGTGHPSENRFPGFLFPLNNPAAKQNKLHKELLLSRSRSF